MTEISAKPFVFVLMPFSKEFSDVYEVGIKSACKDAETVCERADEQIFMTDILRNVYDQIAAADIIVAEMTGRNPNVFYEVGYAHALNKPVILLTQDAADMPFNLQHYPHIVYGGSIAILKTLLEAKIRWCMQNPQIAGFQLRLAKERRIFTLSEGPEFQTYLQNLMLKAKDVRLSGVGLNIIQRDVFATKLFRRAAERNCALEILLSDPFSPGVEVRLIEEERGKMKPPVGQDGLVRRLDTFLRMRKDLGCPDTIKIRLTANYLTFALMIVDSEYFVYPYGYANLGNFSPVFRFSKNEVADSEIIDFFDEHYNRLSADAYDAELAIQARNNKITNLERLRSFALYFIPNEQSNLYEFGTKILGHDIRKGESVASPWEKMVGGAGQFGFHLTLCDAQYFLNEAEVKTAIAEVRFLVKDFKPFDLTDLRIKSACPDARSISVAIDERGGSLEALHHELVHRINRRAVASYYTVGLAKPVRDLESDRAQLMIKRYRAPYVLQRFVPHFTLLTDVPPADHERIYQEIDQLFAKHVQDRTIRVDTLAIVSRPDLNSPWIIETEVEL